MKLLLSSLLLASLCALSSWSVSSGTLVVIQTPDVSVVEGETVNITCCWTEKIGRVRVNWFKNQTEITQEIFDLKKNDTNNCSMLTFPNITKEHSGIYICKVSVEIPSLQLNTGNGSVITVLDKNGSDNNTAEGSSKNTPITVIIALAVVSLLVLIALVCFCIVRRKQARAVRVIYEVPHVNSEEAEMDKHSTSSSRGSSQWCQVPVYESFDYFERVETKETG
ncbi:low affinity immunoglobulin gamma Fc region receptor II-like [Brachyistius frenatus]|uniref:low affinity immunoglobulin gamma Fc region receptor II-like n=1 Tax=Brachyistius frenatus TaxID=100188 RepID=UPI0037E7F730